MEEFDTGCGLHGHLFIDEASRRNERNTKIVIGLTTVMMTIEIAGGMIFKSMALLADGWHMASHAGALAITALAYSFARKHASNPRFTFGTGKVGALGGFASATALLIVAIIMAWESVERIFYPEQISFNQAMLVAVLGLIVNLLSAYLLGHYRHSHKQHKHDHNIRAAYLHVLADALTSITAIIALFCGKYLGLVWMDPMMGIFGAIVITKWSIGLLKDTGRILLDHTADLEKHRDIRKALEKNGACTVTDLHLWQVGSHHLSAIVSISSDKPRSPGYYKGLLSSIDDLVHVTIEVNS